MRRYGPLQPEVLVVWLHGNVSTGGPANSHFRIAEKLAADHAAEKVLAVALVRPGYPDGSGAQSSGSDNGRADNWQRATIRDIGIAIERLRDRFRPRRLVLVGHSGGAAIVAVLLGLRPELAEAALLIGCPCDTGRWRAGRLAAAWSSEDPRRWVDDIPLRTRVIALTGALDTTTPPELGEDYVGRLRLRGLSADFELVPELGHVDVLRSSAVMEATARLWRD